ncbi:hypothetical protein RJ641_024229 [Dillenia turbinata]|uniref:Uncharacterized protein n=1 Tax=Dillenia turbinata TaxID=194707 RepID=A0AAN8YT88_9MAGN
MNHSGMWDESNNEIFSRSSREEDDEEALKWASLEKLPTYNRLKKGLLTIPEGPTNEIDVKKLKSHEKQSLVNKLRMPVWVRWYYWGSPFAWTLYGLVGSQFGDIREELDNGARVEEFLRSYFGFRHDFVGVCAAVLVGLTVLFAFIFAISIKVLNFQRR